MMEVSRSISLEGYSKEEAMVIVHKIEMVTSENHSWIIDFNKYSKTQASFTIETDFARIEKLISDLIKIDIKIFPENYLFELTELRNIIRVKDSEITLVLTLHFILNQKDFRDGTP